MARGGARPGAGRPVIDEEGASWEHKAACKTITLPASEWEWLSHIAEDGKPSTAIKGLLYMARNPTPNGEKIPGLKYRP